MSNTQSILQAPHIDLIGFDPYDGLNCPLFKWSFLSDQKLLKMAWIQFCKRSPINLRPLLGIPRVPNPKGLALLILSHETRLDSGLQGLQENVLAEIESLLFSLKDDRYRAWGYGFPWQNRSFFFPKSLSNTVVSAFVGLALLRRWTRTGRDVYLNHAQDIARFFLQDLFRSELETGICLSYSALDRSVIINTSLLAARFLSEYTRLTGKSEHTEALIPKLLHFAVLTQNADGSWPYGLASNQQWIDSFHTGYNLCALYEAMSAFPDKQVEQAIQKGCLYYENHFFGKNGEALYYAHKPGPIDIHSIAQAIITFNHLAKYFENGEKHKSQVISWTMENMWNEEKKVYAFQRHRHWTNWINYNRWSQAWMHYAHAVEMTHAN